jgi:hypothetical protein
VMMFSHDDMSTQQLLLLQGLNETDNFPTLCGIYL